MHLMLIFRTSPRLLGTLIMIEFNLPLKLASIIAYEAIAEKISQNQSTISHPLLIENTFTSPSLHSFQKRKINEKNIMINYNFTEF